MKKIGEVAKLLNITIDTLRYYEKIKLLNPIKRTSSGIRLYDESDLVRIKFIQQAQKMSFSLDEIRQLLSFRDSPQMPKPPVRQLVLEKISDIETHINELTALKNELKALTAQCKQSMEKERCPILKNFEK